MESWLHAVPRIDVALAAAVLVLALLALTIRGWGGRFRGLPGWFVFWLIFGGILVALSRAHRWASLPALAVLMFVALRTYFFVAPLRPRDQVAIHAAYLSVPFALYLGFAGAGDTFLATVPIILFLLFPALLSLGRAQKGFLDSVGRVLLGVLLFVFCPAHLALLTHRQPGLIELFGLLVLTAELPQRLIGRHRSGGGWLRPSLGVLASGGAAAAMGFWTGPWVGLVEEDGARAGLLVAIAVATGALVSEAVMRDLELAPAIARVGRGAFLDRTVPAVYAAPVFFHYLNHFA